MDARSRPGLANIAPHGLTRCRDRISPSVVGKLDGTWKLSLVKIVVRRRAPVSLRAHDNAAVTTARKHALCHPLFELAFGAVTSRHAMYDLTAAFTLTAAAGGGRRATANLER
jgi:hypothetical protein